MRRRLGDERFEAMRSEGASLSDGEAVAYALECVGWRPEPLAARPAS
jgi:hypothetical protein